MIRFVLLMAAAAGLAGCGGVLRSDAPAEQIYVLRPAAAAPAIAVAPVPGMLAVVRPAVQPGLATTRIALTLPGNRLDYYAAARWGASLSQVVGAFATESLLASRRFELVADADRGGNARYELQLTVRRFEAEYHAGDTAAPQARVEFECLLTTGAPRAVLGRCDAGATVPASANRLGAVIEALEQAAQQAMAQVIDRAAQVAAAPVAAVPTPAGN